MQVVNTNANGWSGAMQSTVFKMLVNPSNCFATVASAARE
jgi:hypothetical protein